MAILGVDKVTELIQTQNLIEGLDPNNMNIEGCGVDLRIGEIYEMSEEGEGSLLIETRTSPKYNIIGKYEGQPGVKVVLQPGKTYSAITVERINTPENLLGWFVPRQTLYKGGVVVSGVRTDPGYKGKFGFIMTNTSTKPFVIEMGARVANMVFHTVEGKTNAYIGQWQGGRAFIEGQETQTKQV